MAKMYTQYCFKHKKKKDICGCNKEITPSNNNFVATIQVNKETATVTFTNPVTVDIVTATINYLCYLRSTFTTTKGPAT